MKTCMVWTPTPPPPPETPARKSLEAFLRTWKRSAGKPKTTWLSIAMNDINIHSGIDLTGDKETDIRHLENLCTDRTAWNKTVGCIISSKRMHMQ